MLRLCKYYVSPQTFAHEFWHPLMIFYPYHLSIAG